MTRNFATWGPLKLWPMLILQKKDTDQKTALILQNLPLKTVILIISRQIHKNTKPKGTIVKAKFKKTTYAE